MKAHFINSEAGRNNYEAATSDLFRITIILPALVGNEGRLTEHAIKVTGWRDFAPGLTEQKFMGAPRKFAKNESDSTQDLTITFTMNYDKDHRNYVKKALNKWRRLVHNSLTGSRVLKADYVGTVIIESFLRDETLVYKRILKNVFPYDSITGGIYDNDYSSNDTVEMDFKITGDWYQEEEQ